MLDMHLIFTLQKKALFFLLALCALGWGFTPYPTVFAGVAVGACFGTYNFWILVRRMDKFSRSVSEGKKVLSLGSLLRFGAGIAAVAIAMTLPQYFHLISTLIGLMLPYILLYLGVLVHSFKSSKN